jgi:hypothetical protein
MSWLTKNAYFARTDDGSFLLSYDALLRLDETVPQEVVVSVMAALTDGRAFQEAAARLPAEQQAAARDLLGILREHGLIVATAADRSAELSALPQWHTGDLSLLVIGGGPLATGLAASLRQCGLSVRVLAAAHADMASEPATCQDIAVLGAALGNGALLCHVAAHNDGVCWSFGDIRGQAPAAPILAAFRRMASSGAATASFDGPGTRIPGETVTAIAAKQIAHGILRASQARPPAKGVTFLDRRTLSTSAHNVAVHPYDVPARQRTPDDVRRDLRTLETGPPLPREELAQRWGRLADERFGVFADLDDTEFRQLPLKVISARVSDTCNLLSAPPAAVGAGIDRESARERAILHGLAAYGSIVVDPRLLSGMDGAFLYPREGDATRLLRSVRAGSVDAFVRAFDLADGRERLLPAQRAFPVLRTRGDATVPCGTSAAPEWRQALTHGLLQHCVRLTVSDSSAQARQPVALAWEDFDHDSGVQFLAAMIKAAGIGPTLHDITGPAGVPVVACVSTSGETVYGGGAQLVDAIREALTAALFRYQLRCDPLLKAAMPMVTSAIWTNPASPASLDPDRLVGTLTNLGYTPSVFALDHDQAVHETFPYMLRVILEQRAR